jgi:recombinational DNA repair protein (RecF pathway)
LPEIRNPHRSDLAQLYFEIWHLKLAGLFPASSSCVECGLSLTGVAQVFYGPSSNGFVCSNCKHGSCHLLSSESYRLLCTMLRKPLGEIISSELRFGQASLEGLSSLIEVLLEKNFERSLNCLQLAHSEC